MNKGHLALAVLMLAQSMTTDAEIFPLEWHVSYSERCGEDSTDLANVLTTVTQMIRENETLFSLPTS